MRIPFIAATPLLCALACTPFAQAADSADKCGDDAAPADVLSCYSVDLSIPDAPGLSIVGLGNEDVMRPSSPRALGMAIQQGLGADGKPRQGLAFDFAPTKLLMPGLTKAAYKDSRLMRALWNSQVSLGVGKPTSEADKSTRIGLGLSSVIWRMEKSDPLLDPEHQACLASALQRALPDVFPADGAVTELPFSDDMKSCYAGLAQRTWNSSALLVGVAAAHVTGTEAAGATSRPRGVWVSFGYGFEGIQSLQPTLHLTATLRSLSEERVADPLDDTAFVNQDSRLFGAKLFRRGGSTNTSIEFSAQRISISGRDTATTRRYAFGFERKVGDNMWLVAAVGSKRGGSDGNQSFLTSGLKFGSATESAIHDH